MINYQMGEHDTVMIHHRSLGRLILSGTEEGLEIKRQGVDFGVMIKSDFVERRLKHTNVSRVVITDKRKYYMGPPGEDEEAADGLEAAAEKLEGLRVAPRIKKQFADEAKLNGISDRAQRAFARIKDKMFEPWCKHQNTLKRCAVYSQEGKIIKCPYSQDSVKCDSYIPLEKPDGK